MININLNSNYFHYSGNLEDVNYSSSAFCTTGSINNQFSLTKNTKLEVNGWLTGPWLEGVTLYKTRGSLNIGMRQSLLNDKLNVSFGMWDILYTQPAVSSVNYSDQVSVSTHKWDSRRVYLTLNYNFGKLKVQQKETKSDNEERGRFRH